MCTGDDSIGEGLLSIGCIPADDGSSGGAAANQISVDPSANFQGCYQVLL